MPSDAATTPDPALKTAFESAVARSKTLPQRPDNSQLLQLYALFKQAGEGDVSEPEPGGFDFVGQAKWRARQALLGMPGAEAMRRYIALVESLA